MNILPDTCINITNSEYTRLVSDANDGNRLKEIIRDRANSYHGLDYSECRILNELFSGEEESEESEE